MADTIATGAATAAAENARPPGFQPARRAMVPLAAPQESDTPEVRRALARLDRLLASGEPPKSDVGRGYYLNIRI